MTSPLVLRGRILDSVDEILHHHNLCLTTADGEIDTAQIDSTAWTQERSQSVRNAAIRSG
jgi:hypothetical protein